MKVEHAFLPRGELVLMITVQSEEDRDDLEVVLYGHKDYCPKLLSDNCEDCTDQLLTVLDTAKEFFNNKEEK